ncbi:hypothetical protein ACFXJ5_28455 [Streptomyces sp. NPDC059373]
MSGHAVVLGCGIAGLTAAAALAPHMDAVTIVERDRLTDGPAERRGVPHGRHLHGLLSTGVRAMDALLPGTLQALLAAGAQRIPLSDGALLSGPPGWMRPAPTRHFVIGASRPLVEFTLRIVQSLTAPVHHIASVRALCDDENARTFVEVGVRPMFTGLTAACLPRDATMAVPPYRATDADQVAAALAADRSPRTAPAAAPRGLNRGVQQP